MKETLEGIKAALLEAEAEHPGSQSLRKVHILCQVGVKKHRKELRLSDEEAEALGGGMGKNQ